MNQFDIPKTWREFEIIYSGKSKWIQLQRVVRLGNREVKVPLGKPISNATYVLYGSTTKFMDRIERFTDEEWELFYLTESLAGRGMNNG